VSKLIIAAVLFDFEQKAAERQRYIRGMQVICGLFQVLFLSLVVNFKFFYSYFPFTAFGPDLFSGTYIKFTAVSVVPDDGELNVSGPSC
jgi:hypothetical protein